MIVLLLFFLEKDFCDFFGIINKIFLLKILKWLIFLMVLIVNCVFVLYLKIFLYLRVFFENFEIVIFLFKIDFCNECKIEELILIMDILKMFFGDLFG